MKERAPKSLDEALCIAWAKSVKPDKKEDERPDRYRQKARSTAKTDTAKSTQQLQSNDRLSKIEADMTKLHEEITKLLEASKTPSIPTANPVIPPASSAVKDQQPMQLPRPKNEKDLKSRIFEIMAPYDR